jgi:hypothetical protein
MLCLWHLDSLLLALSILHLYPVQKPGRPQSTVVMANLDLGQLAKVVGFDQKDVILKAEEMLPYIKINIFCLQGLVNQMQSLLDHSQWITKTTCSSQVNIN